jgi:hypothetical protein
LDILLIIMGDEDEDENEAVDEPGEERRTKEFRSQ